MFVVEISFNKTGQQSEILYVRRPHFIIGSDASSHVVVDEMATLGYSLHFVKGKGTSFVCYSVSNRNEKEMLSETFYGSAKLNLEEISLYVVQIDNDLLIRGVDFSPKNILKDIRKAVLSTMPTVPAIIIFHEKPVIYSIEPATTILLGRSKDCHIRIDAPDVENIHCKIAYENMNFWIEDCGTQYGTFVDGERIVSKTALPACKVFSLANSINIMGVNLEEQIANIKKEPINILNEENIKEEVLQYPCLISKSPLIRPSRITLVSGKEVLMGRAPENDIWIGSPHISRTHLKITLDLKSEIGIFDNSSNGTVCDGMLIGKNGALKLSKGPHIIDFGDSITMGICYSKEDEELFDKAGNSVREFLQLVALNEVKKKKDKDRGKHILVKIQKFINLVMDFYNALDKKGRLLLGFIIIVSFIVLILLWYLITGLAK